MARHVEGLSAMDVKIIQSLQDGASNKEAALDAGVRPTSDIKTPVKRAKKKLKKSRFCEAIRTQTKEDHKVIIMGEKLRPLTPELEWFANIGESHLCFFEHGLAMGWFELDEDGTLFDPKTREGSKK